MRTALAPRRAFRINPDAKQAAEQCLAIAASSDERQFWESYLAVGDNDLFTGFIRAVGDKAAESLCKLVIADLRRVARR